MDAKSLKIERKKEFDRIVAEDILGKKPPAELMFEWSRIADRLIEEAYRRVKIDFAENLNFSVIALGKLGSEELNYSSDIDLLFIYEGDFETASRLAERLVKLLSSAYRVDTALRPEGSRGPLVNTIESLERYYERTSEEWERQSLIRARFVAGDSALGAEFLKRIAPFVFRRSLDVSALKAVRKMKLLLEKSAEEEGKNNIKLGPGGIRELEFFVHTLQMIHGGKNLKLRTQNTLCAIETLALLNIISKKDRQTLANAYLFLRRAENLIQGALDRQIHSLPTDKENLSVLARQMGFKTSKAFIIELDKILTAVQEYFSRLFETDYDKNEIIEGFSANLETCKNREEMIDSISWFKNQVTKSIQRQDLEEKLNIDEISARLTFLAEVLLEEALKLAKAGLSDSYGTARKPDGSSAQMAILGLGKLGAQEMDYGSDLDVIFIYDGDGETDGAKRVTNHEYFTKLSQVAISLITLPTRYGRAYAIDTELRPSGNQGTLVTSFEAFNRYHKTSAEIWERQSLLKARIIAGSKALGRKLSKLIDELAFETPLPANFAEKICELRKKAAAERKTPKGAIEIKHSEGSIADIETIVQCLQLFYGQKNVEVRCIKISQAIEKLFHAGLLNKEETGLLRDAYSAFRSLLSRARLFGLRSGSAIDPKSEYFTALANSLGYKNADELIEKINYYKNKARELYSAKVFSLRS